MKEDDEAETLAERRDVKVPAVSTDDKDAEGKAEPAAGGALPPAKATFGAGFTGFGSIKPVAGTGWLSAAAGSSKPPSFLLNTGSGAKPTAFGLAAASGSGSDSKPNPFALSGGASGATTFGGSASFSPRLSTGISGDTGDKAKADDADGASGSEASKPPVFGFSSTAFGKSGNPFAAAAPPASTAPFVGENSSNKEFNAKTAKVSPKAAWANPTAAAAPAEALMQNKQAANGEEGETVVVETRAKLFLLGKVAAPAVHAPQTLGFQKVESADEGKAKGAAAEGAEGAATGAEAGAAGVAEVAVEANGEKAAAAEDGKSEATAAAATADASAPASKQEWLDRGIGQVKVLVKKNGDGDEGAQASCRIVMRRATTHSLMLNVGLKGKHVAVALQADKMIRFTCMDTVTDDVAGLKGKPAEDGVAEVADGDGPSEGASNEAPKAVPRPCSYLLKTKTKQEATDLLDAIAANIQSTAGEDAV